VGDLDWASVAPGGRLAIMVRHGEARVFSLLDPAPDPAGASVDGVLASPSFAAWAPDSSSVAIYSPTARSAQWIRIRGTNAAADAPIGLTGVEGEVAAFSADAASGLVVFAIAGAGVFRLTASDGPALIAPVADPSALLLEPGAKTLWVADRAGAQLLQVSGPAADASVQTIQVDPSKLSDISALGLSSDQKSLYVADRASLRLYSFDRAGAPLSDGLALGAPATSLTPVGRPSLFLLNQRGQPGEPLYVLDDSSGPNIKFIPANEVR